MDAKWLAVVMALPLGACTFEDGRGWATLRASAAGELTVDDAHTSASGATLVTDLGFELSVDTLLVHLERLDLLETVSGGSSGGSATFDPANPPLGYTLCHGGHCHTADGKTESYEEIEAMLTAGASGSATRVAESIGVSCEVDLLSGLEVAMGSHEIGTVALSNLRVVASRLVLAGTADVEGAATAVEITLDPEGGVHMEADLSAKLGLDGVESPDLALTIAIPGSFLDGIRFDNLEQPATTLLVDSANNTTITELLLARLALIEPSAEFTNP